MTTERWQQIKTILEEFETAAPPDAAKLLERLRADDPSLLADLEPFLVEHTSSAYFRDVIGEQAASLGQASARQERLGPYQLIRRIGQGGMGAVFEAVRTDDFHKRVALKIIKQGLDSDFARTRFLQERQLLATLEHPYIARLLDGGEADDGSPYLVLEFVDGVPITEYAAPLDRPARLQLFLKVCQAVDHAHRNLVVHRDLKPANILVTAAGEPKLLDFGIAKLLDPGAANTPTAFAALTPDYASPEQVRGEPITTASDVYSLGVILYQLLTGRKPYHLDTATPLEMDRVICLQPPASPNLGDELDPILLMALRKEPARRYPGVQKFAEDIEAYLDHRPVTARPDTLVYRSKKFVRRNWWQLAAAALVVISLSAGLAFSMAEQRRANQRFSQMRHLANRFLFDFHDEIANTPGTVKARAMVVSTALEYLGSLAADSAGDPGLQWELAVAYGKVAKAQGSTTSPSFRNRGEAVESFEKAISLARPLADQRRLDIPQQVILVRLLSDGGAMRRSLLEFNAAIRLGREAIERSAGLPWSIQRDALNEMASTLGRAGDLPGSVQARERIVPLVREAAQRDPSFENRSALAGTLLNLGYFQARLTAFPDAMKNESEALSLYQALVAERPADTALRTRLCNALTYLGLLLGAADRPSMERVDEAIGYLERTLGQQKLLMAADPQDKASRNNAGLALNQIAALRRDIAPDLAIRNAAEAAKLLDVSSDNPDDRAASRILAADAHRKLSQYAAAESLLKEAAGLLKTRGADSEADLTLAWARLEAARGDATAAADQFHRTIAISEKLLQKTPTPAAARALTQALEFSAAALPSSAPSNRQRIVAVWTDQNRRYPHHPYLQERTRIATDPGKK